MATAAGPHGEIKPITHQLLALKKAKGLTFAQLGETIGRDEVWAASVLYRQATPNEEQATTLVKALGLDGAEAEAAVKELTVFCSKGLGPLVPTDPLIYRFYEIMQVYGYPMKDVVHEKFGDGIMSAIDFTLNVDREPNPQGDRVKITMSGKFLPYKQW